MALRPAQNRLRNTVTVLMAGTVLTMAAACSNMEDRYSSFSDDKAAPAAENSEMSAKPQTVSSEPAPAANTTRGFKSSKGLVDNRRLFDEPISDPITRIRRIEVAVQDLRDDFDNAIPAMAGLIVSESELGQVLQDLKRSGEISYSDITPPQSGRLPRQPLEPATRASHDRAGAIAPPQTMTSQSEKADITRERVPPKREIEKTQPPKSASKVADKPKTATAPEPETKAPKPELSGTHVLNVRIGTYADKTRIVLDLSAPAQYNVDLDNQEKLLVLEVKGAKWSAKEDFTFKDSKLLSSFTAQDEGANGSRLLLALKQPVKVLKKFSLKADGPRKDRIVLDIAPE